MAHLTGVFVYSQGHPKKASPDMELRNYPKP